MVRRSSVFSFFVFFLFTLNPLVMLMRRSLPLFFALCLLGLMTLTFAKHAEAASFSFTPSTGVFKQGCSAKMDIAIDTQGISTNAADAVVLFNPAEVEIEDQNAAQAGVQVKAGNVYELYVGNVVDNAQGKIMLTGFSIIGTFSGSGNYGSIFFKSKPGVTNTTFQFQFSPGQSTDSNVADTNGNDVLTSVNTASYTFESGSCVPDTQAPSVSAVSPAHGSSNVPLDTDVSFHLQDNQSGVDLNTLSIQLYDVIYDQHHVDVTIAGIPVDYTVTIDPSDDFPTGTEIVLVVSASDLVGNVMPAKVFSFNKPPVPPEAAVCGNGVVEGGETCEPPGAFGCSATCQADVLQCLSVDPALLETLATQAVQDGTLSAEQIAAIQSLEALEETVQQALEADTLVKATSSSKVVEYITRSTRTVVEGLGCTENCVKILFGEQQERWYVPTGMVVLLFLLAGALIYQVVARLRRGSSLSAEVSEKRQSKRR